MKIKDKKSLKVIREGLEDLAKDIKEGKSDRLKEYLKFVLSFRHYSFYNTFLIYSQMQEATRVAGFRKWNSLGYKIKKGSKAIRILAPGKYRYYEIMGQKVFIKKESEIPEGKKLEEGIYYFGVNVFDKSQTEKTEKAEDMVDDFFYNIGNDFKDIYIKILGVLKVEGVTVKEEEIKGGAQGYATVGKRISIKKSNDYNNKLLTLIHEWAHIKIHLGNYVKGFEFKIEDREVQAEAVSFIVGNYLGLKNPFSSDYIISWGRSTEALSNNLKYIVKASKEMIREIEEFEEIKIKMA